MHTYGALTTSRSRLPAEGMRMTLEYLDTKVLKMVWSGAGISDHLTCLPCVQGVLLGQEKPIWLKSWQYGVDRLLGKRMAARL